MVGVLARAEQKWYMTSSNPIACLGWHTDRTLGEVSCSRASATRRGKSWGQAAVDWDAPALQMVASPVQLWVCVRHRCLSWQTLRTTRPLRHHKPDPSQRKCWIGVKKNIRWMNPTKTKKNMAQESSERFQKNLLLDDDPAKGPVPVLSLGALPGQK